MKGIDLKTLREQKKLTQEELGKKLGKSMRTVITWEKSDALSKSQINQIDAVFKEDNEITSQTNKTNSTYKAEGKVIKDEDYPSKEVYVIPIKGRGGLENTYFDEVMFKELEKEVLTIKNHSSNGSKWFKIEVEGISMDDGSKKSLEEGDWAYCRSIGKQYWKNKFHAHKYPIFCFFHNERGIIFKTIKEQNLETGELILSSLHPDKNKFPDFKINVSGCSYICNVIKVLSEF